MHKVLLTVFFLSCLPTFASAQLLDPYRRINDPLAIADLDGPDGTRIVRSLHLGYNGLSDTDGYDIWAADTGVGILRHIWVVYNRGLIPPNSRMKLWVDDSLLIDATTRDFFASQHGLIRSPFDTVSAGAGVCESQIPYKHGFRLTHLGDWSFHEVEWQRIDTANATIATIGSSTFAQQQALAESNYYTRKGLDGAKTVTISGDIASGDSMTVALLKGPGYIQRLQFHFNRLDISELRGLRLAMYWDNRPVPSIDIPISDLFGVAAATPDIHSFFFSVDSANGMLEFSFPMPYKVSARVCLTNRSPVVAKMNGMLAYRDTAWYSGWGYFTVQHHISPEISYKILHPLLHTKGAGRYVGAIFYYPSSLYPSPIFMEGDGYFKVDSLPYLSSGYSNHYIGTEDYCDGGWYFLDSSALIPPVNPPLAFSLPFRGCPSWPNTVYRLQVNAPFNYTKSMDIDFGHGFNDDYTTTYRTTAFYYERWIPFYPSSDTITYGNRWKISGSGYSSQESITVQLDTDTIYSGAASPDGTFDISLNVSRTWRAGDHTLSINNILYPQRITILDAPRILYVQDSAGRVFSDGDSIEIRGYGFQSGEELSLRLGDTLFTSPSKVFADRDGVVRLKAFLPWAPEGKYQISARRSDNTFIISDSVLFITRTLNYEFELLHNLEGTSQYGSPNVHVSQGGIAFCYGDWTPNQEFSFAFEVPFPDSFAVTVYGLQGDRYAIYHTFIDTTAFGTHDWYELFLSPDSDQIGHVFLSKGTHIIHFLNVGKADSAREYSIGLDHMHLKPLSEYSRASIPGVPSGGGSIKLFPNPLDQNTLSISGVADSVPGVSFTLFDEIGRQAIQGYFQKQATFWTTNISSIINGRYWLVLHLPNRTLTLPLLISRQD